MTHVGLCQYLELQDLGRHRKVCFGSQTFHPRIYSKDHKAEDTVWAAAISQKVVLDISDGSKGKDKGKGKGKKKGKLGNKCVSRVLQ